jgi:hypothetical protein
VTHRITVLDEADTVRFEFHGLLDPAALASLEAAVAFARRSGAAVRVVLRSGTEVDRSVVPELRTLDVTLDVESPYLARWLAREP